MIFQIPLFIISVATTLNPVCAYNTAVRLYMYVKELFPVITELNFRALILQGHESLFCLLTVICLFRPPNVTCCFIYLRFNNVFVNLGTP